MKNNSLSRRAAVAAALGSGLAGARAAAAQEVGPPSAATAGMAGSRVYDIRDYGARGDGKTLDTAAFQAAIDKCSNDKGGTVLVPAGTFLIGAIRLKSNVTFHLAAMARVLGSTNINDYTPPAGSPATPGGAVLIAAVNADNVSIEGTGTVDGQGAEYLPGARDDGERDPGRPRPHLLIFSKCRHLTIRHVFFTNSAYHCCRILQSSFVLLDGVRIHTRVHFNNDGFHINSCEHVKISNSNVACEDDACALFGSNRDVTVTNCTFSTRWSVFRFGGGVSENITVSNCVIHDTFGCPIKAQIGAGSRMENMVFSNLVMNNVTGPIYIGLGSVPRNSMDPKETGPGGVVRNILFHGIRATIAAAPDLKDYPYAVGSPISGIYPGEHRTCIDLSSVAGQFLENISFNDVHITYAGGGTAQEGALRDVPQVSGAEYFGLGVLPAYGMYARNVRALSLANVRFDVAAPDLRPALVFDHVEDAIVNGFSAQGNTEAESLVRCIDTRDVLMTACRAVTPSAVFLRVEGARSSGITIDGGDLSKAASPVSIGPGAARDAVRLR